MYEKSIGSWRGGLEGVFAAGAHETLCANLRA
jgi:hypothetical protein